MNKQKLRVLLADDHQIVRDGLRLLIDSQENMFVAGEAENGKQALARAAELKPDVVVMDLSMPEMNGLQATVQLKARFPDLKVIVLTAHEDETYLSELCKAGASGYVLKRSAGDDLIQTIAAVARGEVRFEASLVSKALVRQMGGTSSGGGTAGKELSERERQVLSRLAWGYTNKEIAGSLELSVKTVETYKVRISEKLGLRSRTEMVQYALRKGWLHETTPPV